MNKDVIYIEPEDDITDILANIKSAKNKIIALVPPKKAGVLRSAVNFKLITKTAKQASKTVVLITSDESLLKLANNVKMPTAKTLQSRPKLPIDIEADEFGADDDDLDIDEIIDREEKNAAKEELTRTSAQKDDDGNKKDNIKKSATATPRKKKTTDLEVEDDFVDDSKDDEKPNRNIPDFNKVRKPIVITALALLLIFGFCFWAFSIAPAAKIIVKIKTASQNLSENISFVTDESKAKPEEGIFYIEEKTIKETAESEFSATGEIDKGSKAAGSITVKALSPVIVKYDNKRKTIDIPAGTSFSYDNKSYVSSTAASINITEENIKPLDCKPLEDWTLSCDLFADASTTINVVAADSGDKYNIAEATSGWSTSVSGVMVASSSAMTGGTSKKVKVVSQKDVETAEAGLESEGESEARGELMRQFSNKYLLIEDSFFATSGKLSSSPAINEEVKDGVKPKVIKEFKYTIYAVERDALNKFIKAKADVGDDTQTIYSTGISEEQSDDDKGRVESFKKDKDQITGILKTVIKTGPEVTEQMLADKALGKKIGEVQSLIKSIKGINEVKVDTSYFWVTSVPDNPNKVSYDITVE